MTENIRLKNIVKILLFNIAVCLIITTSLDTFMDNTYIERVKSDVDGVYDLTSDFETTTLAVAIEEETIYHDDTIDYIEEQSYYSEEDYIKETEEEENDYLEPEGEEDSNDYIRVIPFSETVNSWTDLAAAVANPEVTTIELAQNIPTQNHNAIVIPIGRDITITSTSSGSFKLTQETLNQRHFVVDGTLRLENITLSGSQEEISYIHGGIQIRGGRLYMTADSEISNNRAASGGGVIIQNVGTFMMQGGLIYNNRANAGGGGVQINGNSSMAMSGLSRVEGNIAFRDGGGVNMLTPEGAGRTTFTMSDRAEIYNNTALSGGGGGVFIRGDFTLSDNAEISSNRAYSLPGFVGPGGGVRVMIASSTFTMNGGTIFGNISENAGGGIHLGGGISANIADAVIYNNTATLTGGGIHISESPAATPATISVSGESEIEYNRSGTAGGGILLGANARLELSNYSIIEDNTAATGGGGVYMLPSTGVGRTTFMMSDNTIVYNNTSNGNGGGGVLVRGDFTMSGNALIAGNYAYSVPGAPGAGGGVRVMVATSTFTMNGGEISGNISDNAGGGLHLGGGIGASIADAVIYNNTAALTGGGIHASDSPATTPATISLSGESEIEYNRAESAGGGIHIGANARLELSDFSIIKRNAAGTTGGGTHLFTGSTLIMSDETIISENRAYDGGGGGVHVSAATFTMRDEALIENNKAVNTGAFGGGVRLWGSSMFNFDGGTIYNNHADGTGGGVNVGGSSNFTMSENTEITENTASSSAGIHGDGTAILVMTGGSVNRNISVTTGGGVGLATNATFIMSGSASIYRNEATTNGGGLFATGDATINMEGGYIDTNESNNHGGGVMLWVRSQFNLSGGTIVGNISPRAGGGIGIANNGTAEFYMTSGSIIGNSAGAGGGGIGFTGIANFADIDTALLQVSISNTDTSVVGNTAPVHESYQLRDNHISRINATVSGSMNGFNNEDIHTMPLFQLSIIDHFLSDGNLSGAGYFEAGDPVAIYRAPTGENRTWLFSHWEFRDDEGNLITNLNISTETYADGRYRTTFNMPSRHITATAMWNIAPTLEFYKTDMTIYINPDEAGFLHNAVFHLYFYDNNVLIETQSSDVSGRVKFEYEFITDGTYRLVEYSTPLHFVHPTSYWLITIEDGVMSILEQDDNLPFVEIDGELHVGNQHTVPFTFHKTNDYLYSFSEWDTPDWLESILLPDAEFSLFRYNGIGGTPADGMMTGDDWVYVDSGVNLNAPGNVTPLTFQLIPGRYYHLVETIPPIGHELPFGQWRIIAIEREVDGMIEVGFQITAQGDSTVPAFANPNGTHVPYVYINGMLYENVIFGGLFYLGNFPQFILPPSGGSGTIALMIFGLLAILSAVISTIWYTKVATKRKSQ